MHAEGIILVLSCFGGYLAAGAAHYAHAPAEYATDGKMMLVWHYCCCPLLLLLKDQ